MSGDVLLWVGAVAIFAALVFLLLSIGIGRPREVSMRDRLGGLGAEAVEQPKALASGWGRVTAFAGRQVEARGRERALGLRLESAGLTTLPGEYVAASAAVAGVAALLGLLVAGVLGALVLAAAALYGAHLWLSRRINQRRTAFDDQLPAALQLLSGSLRAGYGLIQACDSVSQEMEAPLGDEFERLVRETQMGRSIYDALESSRQRVANDDFSWVIEAIAIHRDIGGDLAELIDNVSETIRARNRIRRRVKALSAEGRLSAIILFVLPLVMTLVLRLGNPDYFTELTGTTMGQIMIVVGVVLLLIGGAWLRRLIRIQF